MKLVLFWLDIGSGHKPGVNHGIVWVASYLRSIGHDIILKHVDDRYNADRISKTIDSFCPDCVGFSITTNQRRYLDIYAKRVRNHFDGLIIAGGVHPSLDPEDVLKCQNIDGVCIGEGEIPLAKLGHCIDSNISYFDIASFWWKIKKNSSYSIKKNKIEAFEKDLNKFPLPDYSLFKTTIKQTNLGGYANIMLSRGCPYNCAYCCNHAIKAIYPKRNGYFRIVSVERAIQILKKYRETFPETKGFIFEDDLLPKSIRWFKQFSESYRRNIGLPYICNARFEHVQNVEIARLLSISGCRLVMFGLESGDEKYRKETLNRNYTNKQVISAIGLLREMHVPFFTYNIFGFPGETRDQMEKTVSLNKLIRPNSGMSFFFYPYPKTDLYNHCLKNNLLLPKQMNMVSGYREKPVIKQINCTEKDCIYQQQKLMLYLLARRFTRVMRLDITFFDNVIHATLMLAPRFFTNLLTKENSIKRSLRAIQYKRL